MFRDAIKLIKSKNNITYVEILEKADLPASDRTALGGYVLKKRAYPVDKVEKILKAFNVKLMIEN